MFRHILVPLDGSLRAERAIPVATRLARASGGMLILLRAVKAAPEFGSETSTGSQLFQTAIQSELTEALNYLTEIASSSQLSGLPLTVLAPQGSVIATIQEVIHTYQVDLLVCCEQSLAGAQQFLGSFAEQLGQHLTIPFLLLPEQDHTLAEWQGPLTCLVAFAGAQPESCLIQPAVSLLASQTERETGHLHFAPLRSVAANSTAICSDQQGTAPASEPARRSAVLLKEARTEQQVERGSQHLQNEIIVLGMPLRDGDQEALLDLCAYPRLFVPSLVESK